MKLLEQDARKAQSACSKAKNQLKYIDEQIAAEIEESRKQGDVIVSEHALLRFFERALGYRLEEIKNDMIPDDVKVQIQTLGSGKYPIGNNLKAIVKNGTVVSVVNN